MRYQRGHIALYSLVFTPVALALIGIGIDISGWSALRDEVQERAESIATRAAQALPNSDRAETIALREIARISASVPGLSGTVLVERNAEVSVTLFQNYQPKLLPISAESSYFSVAKTVTIQLHPTDVSVILSNASTLRPGLTSPGLGLASPWGAAEDWPAAPLFGCLTNPNSTNHSAIISWNTVEWNNEQTRRWATQSCFNPAFQTLKDAALLITGSASAIRTNRTGVIVTPGDRSGSGYKFLRSVSAQSGLNEFQYGFSSSTVAGAWPAYREFETQLGSEACVLFSASNLSLLSNPYSPNFISPTLEGIDTVSIHCGAEYYPFGSIDEDSLARSTLQEAIYFTPAVLPSATSAGEAQIARAIEVALSDLLPRDDITELESVRGALAAAPLRSIIVLSDSLPTRSELEPQITGLLERGDIQLSIFAYHHPYLSAAAASTLETNFQALQNLSTELSQQGKHLLLVRKSTQSEDFIRAATETSYRLLHKTTVKRYAN